MEWENIAKGGPKSQALAAALFSHLHASKIVPLDSTEKMQSVDITIEDLVSCRESVYRVFPNGAIDHGVEEKAKAAATTGYFVVLTVRFYSGGELCTETLEEVLEAKPGDDAESLYFQAWVKFREQYTVDSSSKVLCWSFTKNQLD